MSKFEELCNTYSKSHEEIAHYLESCAQFFQYLITGMESYLQCPDKRVQFRNKAGEERTLREAMYLRDGLWRLDTEIVMCREGAHRRRLVTFSGQYYPSQTVLLPLTMKRVTAEVFVTGICGYERQFTLDMSNKDSFYKFYEFIYDTIQAHYRDILQAILKLGEAPNKVGIKCTDD
jgi:hypothetical protein